jgi:polygalacturonase
MKTRILIYSIMLVFFLPLQGVTQNSGDWKLPAVIEPAFKKDTFTIVKFGAINDGITLNTKSINSAIRECSSKGGGVVLVPNGLWLTGPIELKSNVNLHLQRNATLLFTADKSQYALIESNWEGVPAVRNQSPVSGTNLENVAITGKGIIDGNGDAWREVKKSKLTSAQWKKLIASGGLLSEDEKIWYPSEQYMKGSKLEKPGVLLNGKTLNDYTAYKDYFRPNIVVLSNCKKVLLDGPTFQNSAAWGLHPLMCENLTVRDVFVKTPWYAQNGDGIDVESCSNVLIENSSFDVGDDGICIKSGRDEEGRKRGMPTQNLIVRNCVVYHAHGGFVIGSEMSGGVKNLYVEDCTFIGTDIGLRFKTKRGRGGIVENVFIRNIAMKDIVGEAILFDMYYDAKDPIVLAGESREVPKVETFPVSEATPQFKNFYIQNVACNGAEKAIFVRGLPEMSISDVYFQDVIIKAEKGIEITEAKNVQLKNVQVILDKTDPVVSINNSSKILIDGIKYDVNSELLFNMVGMKNEQIKVRNTDASKAKNKAKFSEGANAKSLEIK